MVARAAEARGPAIASFARRQPSPALVLSVLLLLGGLLLGSELLNGWFAYDEGALGQSAERVLGGEVPHRDFDEVYTGLLTYMHAAVFAVFGPGLVVMRLALFVASLTWLWAMYRIAERFAPPLGAALVALAAFTWSVPNYTAAMPSWYILFVATFGALALVRWHETGAHRWIMLAGAAGGVAFLFKLSGIFFLLGGGLALLAAGPATGETRPPGERESHAPADVIVRALFALLLVGMIVVLARVAGNGDREMLRHVMPTALVALAIAARLVMPRAGSAVPWRAMLSRIGSFALGAFAPVAVFFVFYALVGGLGAMFDGVFVTPFRRLAFAALRPPVIASVAFGVPLMALLWSSSVASTALRRWVVPGAAAIFFAAVLAYSIGDSRFYRLGWYSAWGLLFFIAIEAGRQVLTTGADTTPRAAALSLACIAVGMSLIEYPYAAHLYTLYAFPLTLLAVAAMMRASQRGTMAFHVLVAAFFLAFGWLRVIPGNVQSLGLAYTRPNVVVPLELPRGGLRIPPYEAIAYERVIPFVTEVAAGRTIWAGPDSPEVYFLSEQPNRTRAIFDFLDPAAAMTAELVERLDSLGVSVIVLKLQPPFSAAPTVGAVEALRRVYPNERAMPGFLVLWR